MGKQATPGVCVCVRARVCVGRHACVCTRMRVCVCVARFACVRHGVRARVWQRPRRVRVRQDLGQRVQPWLPVEEEHAWQKQFESCPRL